MAGVILGALAICAGAEAGGYRAPRTAAGAPDLEGVWTTQSLTSLERPEGLSATVVSEAEAKAFEATHDGTPAIPGDDVGHSTSEWWDLGARLARMDGKIRGAWLTDPPDGRLPYTEAGRKALGGQVNAMLSAYDGPEVRPAPERCLVGAASSSTPPILNAAYNSNLQIVQTADHVVIVTEMTRDARIVPLRDARQAPGPDWNGQSVGRWEGDTLVVETAGFHPGAEWRMPAPLYISAEAKVTERFTRVSADEIRYAFVVEDPKTYSRTWRGELPLRPAPRPMYEFACHEGNYSLTGVLSGARQKERETPPSGAAPKPTPP